MPPARGARRLCQRDTLRLASEDEAWPPSPLCIDIKTAQPELDLPHARSRPTESRCTSSMSGKWNGDLSVAAVDDSILAIHFVEHRPSAALQTPQLHDVSVDAEEGCTWGGG
jgi:hypothetical protein